MEAEKYYYYFDDKGYYTYKLPETEGALRPTNSTYTDTPEEPWDGQWPKWNGTEWILEKDYYNTVYWPKGSTYKDSGIQYEYHGSLPEGSTTEKPIDPNQSKKDTLLKNINDIQLELQDLDIDIRYLERKVSRHSSTDDDKAILEELKTTKEELTTQLNTYLKELSSLDE